MTVSKRVWHHYQTQLRKLNPKVLLVLVLLLGFTTAVALRSNNVHMLSLRKAVFTADKEGEGVNEALTELRKYVYAHMNTDLSSGGVSIKPPIQLKYTYERLIEGEKQRVAAHNKKVTSEAPEICEAQHPAGQIRARAACVDTYIEKNTITANDTVPKELYQFDFASPAWSPDFAGYALLATLALLALLIARLILGVFISYELK